MHHPSTSDTRIDRIGIALASTLAITTLLPAGLTHLGWPERSYVELAVPALLAIWIAARLSGQRAVDTRVTTWPWDLFAAAVTGAAIYGLMADNPLSSPVFPPRLIADVGDLFRPMNMTAHPLYSLRVGLTFLEGWMAFRLVLAICRLAPDPGRRASLALAGWIAGLALVAIGALLQYVTAFNLHPYWVRANPALVRAHSALDDPNTLGAVLVLGIGLMAGLLRLDGPARRLWWAGLTTLFAIGLVTTMSRAAFGAAVLAPLGILAIGPAPSTPLQRRLRLGARVVMIAILAAVAGSMLLRGLMTEQRRTHPTGPVDMLIKTFDPRESTGWVLRGRLPWWQAGVAMFADHPDVGVGLGRYPRLMEGYGGGPMRENTHNLFLQIAAEAGVVGLVTFVLLCGSLGAALGRGVVRGGTPHARAVALGGTIGVLAFLLTMLTGHALLLPSGQIVFAGFVALTLTIAGGGSTVPWRTPVVLIAALALTAVAPLTGRVRGIEPRPGRWGHHLGLHDQEHADTGVPYRWTMERAVLDLVVPDGVSTLVVDVAAVYPVRDGVPTRVVLTAGGETEEVALTSDERHRVRIPLATGARRVVLRLAVSPTFIPGGGDPRELGVQVFLPEFE